MLAYALHIMRTTAARKVSLHLDGEHAKRFEFRSGLLARGFELASPRGSTAYGGTYRHVVGLLLTTPLMEGMRQVASRMWTLRGGSRRE